MAEFNSEVENYYETVAPPENYANYVQQMKDFCLKHNSANKKIVLVTSGGTTVPLEHNTVRFVDNFSAGTRGSASTEYFLQQNYAVIFLFRLKSLEPFKRHFITDNFLDHLEIKKDNHGCATIEVSSDKVSTVLPRLEQYKQMRSENSLLSIPFVSLSDYLWLLKGAAEALNPLGKTAMMYLAAAVSDFYLPPDEMALHKIHSSTPLNINLKLVPKMLRPLVRQWVPNAYIVSFKLETNPEVVIEKAREALKKYGHEMVIANILQTRKFHVTLITETSICDITLTDKDEGMEIEEKIVNHLVNLHKSF